MKSKKFMFDGSYGNILDYVSIVDVGDSPTFDEQERAWRSLQVAVTLVMLDALTVPLEALPGRETPIETVSSTSGGRPATPGRRFKGRPARGPNGSRW